MAKTEHKDIPIKEKRLRLGKLESLNDVARLQVRLVKRAAKSAFQAGGGDEKTLNAIYKLGVLTQMLGKSLEESSLEKRLKALEDQLHARKI
jgi:hypothetical protein